MMGRIAAAALAAMLLAGPAAAQQKPLSWQGYGSGTMKCTRYLMTIQVTPENGRAKGIFQQEGRPQRNFDLPIGANGSFKGDAQLSGGNKIAVSGRIAEDGGRILLDGYCRFGGPLKPST